MKSDAPVSESSPRGLWLLLAAFLAIWFPTINQLRFEWSINEQYSYGWFVPFFSLYLFINRWKSRPQTGVIHAKAAVIFAVVIFALLLFPLRLMQEAHPDWRLVGGSMAGVSFLLSLCALYLSGGMPWVKHFIFPICFILISVPWPTPVEQSIIQKLMRAVTASTVETLSWCAIPALQHGNVITLSTGSVGVEEACSGVRSLQTSLMVSLFLGELFRFGVVRRIVLVALAIFVAYVLNIGRSFFLVMLCVRQGQESVLKWHDPVGNTVLIVSLAMIGGLAFLLRKKRSATEVEVEHVGPGFNPRVPSWITILCSVIWLCAIEGLTEYWFRIHEGDQKIAPFWSVAWPESQTRFREIKLPETTRSMLLYNEGRSAAWTNPDQSEWSMVFLRWLPGRVSSQLARSHGPELCLAAAGAIMEKDLGWKPMQIGNVLLPVRAYVFTAKRRPIYVFYCIWDTAGNADMTQDPTEEMTYARRFDAVLKGHRNPGQQMLEIGISNVRSAADAEVAVREMLERSIR